MFPLGGVSKPEVRQLARDFGLPVAERAESQDLCFLGDQDYREFLARHAPQARRPGEIRNLQGELLGEHQGLANYTIGQRKGLRLSVGRPLFVTEIRPQTSTVVVGPREALERTTFTVGQVNWISGEVPAGPVRADVQIRHRHAAAPATIDIVSADRVEVRYDAPQSAVTPGQAAVFFDGDVVMGGGWIRSEDGGHWPVASGQTVKP